MLIHCMSASKTNNLLTLCVLQAVFDPGIIMWLFVILLVRRSFPGIVFLFFYVCTLFVFVQMSLRLGANTRVGV